MKREPQKGTVQLPYVDPAVTANPAAARYAQQMAARKQGAMPRGGGDTPPIPRLDQPAQDGMTMADQARFAREQGAQGPSIMQGGAMHRTQQAPIRPTDLLPEQARSDPGFREGQGNMYAINQLHLAMKYGVIRDGKHVPAAVLMGGGPQKGGMLRQETVEGLEAISKFNQQRQHVESGDAAVEDASAKSIAGEAAKLADPSPDPEARPLSKEEVDKAMQNMDDFDFDTLRDLMMKDILNNQEQRDIVEARLDPLDLSEIIEKGYVTQRVPIVPGKWEPTLQSVTAQEELALKRLLMDEVGSVETPNRYILDKFRLMVICAGLRAVNNRVLPDHRDQNGDFNDDLFWKKFNLVLRLAFHMLASVAVHYHYFDIRVRSLFKAVKNG